MIEAGALPVVVAVALGSRWIAIRAEEVCEVLGNVPIVALPGGPDGLVGVVAWRGRAVAVLDLGPLVGDQPFSDSRARMLLLQVGMDAIALPVDRAREARAAESARPAHTTRTRFCSLEVEVGGQLMPLFDLAQWLAALERSQG